MLWQLLQELASHQQPYLNLFAVVKGQRGSAPTDGFGADYAGSLLIEEALYVAAEGFDCNYSWQQFSLRALGNGPFWTATVMADDIKVTQLDQRQTNYVVVSKRRDKQGIYYQGKGKESGSVELAVITRPCRDSMSGAYYGLTATLKFDGKVLTGCAIQGEGIYC